MNIPTSISGMKRWFSGSTQPPQRPVSIDEQWSFITAKASEIPGWLAPQTALLTAALLSKQRELGINGPLFEVGVFRGRYLSVLHEFSSERVVGYDLFVGAEDVAAPISEVRTYIENAHGQPSQRLQVRAADSTKLSPAEVVEDLGGKARFISIDGGHDTDTVAKDAILAEATLAEGGIIAFDDFFNHSIPNVTDAILRHLYTTGSRLEPFAIWYNKLYATTAGHGDVYYQASLQLLENADCLPNQRETLQRMEEYRQHSYVPEIFGRKISFLL